MKRETRGRPRKYATIAIEDFNHAAFTITKAWHIHGPTRQWSELLAWFNALVSNNTDDARQTIKAASNRIARGHHQPEAQQKGGTVPSTSQPIRATRRQITAATLASQQLDDLARAQGLTPHELLDALLPLLYAQHQGIEAHLEQMDTSEPRT